MSFDVLGEKNRDFFVATSVGLASTTAGYASPLLHVPRRDDVRLRTPEGLVTEDFVQNGRAGRQCLARGRNFDHIHPRYGP